MCLDEISKFEGFEETERIEPIELFKEKTIFCTQIFNFINEQLDIDEKHLKAQVLDELVQFLAGNLLSSVGF